MLLCGDPRPSHWPLYNGTGAPRLCWPRHRLAAIAAVLATSISAGCSYRLDSILPKSDANVEQTGSIARADRPRSASYAAQPSETDLAYARAVAAEAMARGGRDLSIPWENPHTGAGGNITPLAAVSGVPCRDFLASYVQGQAQTWLQGEACRTERGQWEVRSLKPFTQG